MGEKICGKGGIGGKWERRRVGKNKVRKREKRNKNIIKIGKKCWFETWNVHINLIFLENNEF